MNDTPIITLYSYNLPDISTYKKVSVDLINAETNDTIYNLILLCRSIPDNVHTIYLTSSQYIECYTAIEHARYNRKYHKCTMSLIVLLTCSINYMPYINYRTVYNFCNLYYMLKYKSKMLSWMWRSRERIARQWSTPEKLQEFIDEHPGEELEDILEQWEVVVRLKLPWMGGI